MGGHGLYNETDCPRGERLVCWCGGPV